MNIRILVLGSREVKFEDDDKQTIEGVRVHYGMEGGKTSEGSKGFTPVSAFLRGPAAKDLIKAVPGFYQGEFEVSVKDSQPHFKLIGMNFEGPATIAPAKAG